LRFFLLVCFSGIFVGFVHGFCFLFSFPSLFKLCHCLCLVLWELLTTIELSYNFEPLLLVVVFTLNAIASISSPSSFTFSPFLLLWVQFVVVILCFPLFTCASFGALKLWTLTSNLFLGVFILFYFSIFVIYFIFFVVVYFVLFVFHCSFYVLKKFLSFFSLWLLKFQILNSKF
jgi:hypothetical protein